MQKRRLGALAYYKYSVFIWIAWGALGIGSLESCFDKKLTFELNLCIKILL